MPLKDLARVHLREHASVGLCIHLRGNSLCSTFHAGHCSSAYPSYSKSKFMFDSLQERPYATGLDTGCCYGDRLTAAVLPALKDLKALGDASGGRHLDKLGAKIISVPAHEKYYDVDPCD